jgi:putative nucleotidyltransferase with HDIG domain
MGQASILLVEDEGIVAKDLEMTLTRLGYNVLAIASTGKRAVELALTKQPELVLMDIHLPGEMDGVEAYTQIVAQQDVPAIYITAYADDVTLQRAKTTGPLGFLLRPFTERDLASVIEIALYKHAMEKSRQALYEALQLQEQQLRNRVLRLTAMRAIDQAIITDTNLHNVLQVILGQICQSLQADAAAVLLLNPFSRTLEYVSSQGFHSDEPAPPYFRMGEGYAGQIASEQQPLQISELKAAPKKGVPAAWLTTEGFVCYQGWPLIAKGQVRGVLEVFHRQAFLPGSDWLEFLEALADQTAIAIDNASMLEAMQRSHMDLVQAYNATIEGWARALELRDRETIGHSRRVTDLALHLADALGFRGEDLGHIRRGALLHDIGKMGIPDNILLKPGPLDPEEWEIMRQHPSYAYELLSPIPFLHPALDIVFFHHEKWDGSGYPRGLKGEEIPLAARIFAIVDVWDALLSDRPYQKAWPQEQVVEYIGSQSGKYFDPHIVEVFLDLVATKKPSDALSPLRQPKPDGHQPSLWPSIRPAL